MKQDPIHSKPIPSFTETVAFHGHACPGLALGYRVALAAIRHLSVSRAKDEDLVAIVENDACGVDAVQFVCGCTFGKGNLIFRNHGKHVYTFFNRNSGAGIRIYAEPPERDTAETAGPAHTADGTASFDAGRKQRIEWLLALPEADWLHISAAQEPPPSKARIHASSRCSLCGERMMETRVQNIRGKALCIACAAEGLFAP